LVLAFNFVVADGNSIMAFTVSVVVAVVLSSCIFDSSLSTVVAIVALVLVFVTAMSMLHLALLIILAQFWVHWWNSDCVLIGRVLVLVFFLGSLSLLPLLRLLLIPLHYGLLPSLILLLSTSSLLCGG